jgi:microcystin-dependent protein
MTEPTTVNVGLIVPNTGDLVGVWGSNAINPDLLALDGFLGGFQIVSASNAPIILTSPSGFTPTPSGGPTQAQNLVLSCVGTLTADVRVTLPIPGSYIVENLTTGNFVLSFAAAGSGRVVAVDQGEEVRIYNNGTNVRFVNLGRVGHTEIWAGLSAMPAWVGACTVPPYLLCDGAIYNFSTYPYLGKRLGSTFGGNGGTTFGVPDLRGRMAVPYDGTGTRITAAGCGLNGQTLGATLDEQTIALTAAQIPSINTSVSVSGSVSVNTVIGTGGVNVNSPNSTAYNGSGAGLTNNGGSGSFSGSGSGASTNTGGQAHPNVQPSQVTGIAVIRAA